MEKRIVLCADDYGQALAISQGIVSLAQQNKIAATSCMVTSPHWREHAEWLKPFIGKIDIGLHLNFTEGKPLSAVYKETYGPEFFSLTSLMKKSLLHRLDQEVLEAESRAQVDHFAEVMGRLPDFIDGHQHVHQFPIIRAALIQVYLEQLRSHHTYIRLVDVSRRLLDWFRQPKKMIIYQMGTEALKNILNQHHIPHNTSFSGIYPFSYANQYPKYFLKFLAESQDLGIIMCHPGLEASDGQDLIAKARYAEYQYFASEQFESDCKAQNAVIKGLR